MALLSLSACSKTWNESKSDEESSLSESLSATGFVFPHSLTWEQDHGQVVYNLQTMLGETDYSTCTKCHEGDENDNTKFCKTCHAYPHNTSWSTSHSTTSDITTCQKCHGEDYLGGKSEKSCLDCHLTESHLKNESNWSAASGHGSYVIANGKETCVLCHGEKLIGGSGNAPSCFKCHPGYHDSWSTETEHGITAKKSNSTACTPCHGSDYKGGNTKVSCYKCHTVYPHPTGFVKGSTHGDTYRNDKSTCENECHGTDLSDGGLSGVVCSTCHELYPDAHESENFLNPLAMTGFHGSIAEGEAREVCKDCHGDDLKGGISGKSCYSCHTIHSSDYLEEHGAEVVANGYNSCQSYCHGSDLSGGLIEVACSSCHHYPHSAEYENGGHEEAIGDGKELYCAPCHGDDFTGGSVRKSCTTCHTEYPHAENFADEIETGHPADFIQKVQGGDTADCTDCHGTSYDTELDGNSCVTCHTSGKVVHDTTSWSNADQHGKYVSDNSDSTLDGLSCPTCHGNPAEDMSSSYSTKSELEAESECYDCHWTYPHLIGNATIGWEVAHMMFVRDSTLMVDSTGYNPPDMYDSSDPQVEPTVEYTCGGSTANNCHYNKYRTDDAPSGIAPGGCAWCH